MQRRQSANGDKGNDSVRQVIAQILRRLHDRWMHCAKRRAVPQKYGEADELTRAKDDIQQKIYCSR